MPIKLHFQLVYQTLPLDSPDQLKTLVTNMLPSPAPADLRIVISTECALTITYSQDFQNTLSAAQHALKVLKKELPA